METINNDVIDKVKALLRLATSENEFERDRALCKCKEICLKNNLDISSIEAWDETKNQEEVIRNDLQMGNRFQVTQKYLWDILQKHFGVRVILSGGRYNGRKICLIGTKTNVELASYANEFLNHEFSRRWLDYKKRSGVRVDEKNSFLWGIAKGLGEKLSESEDKFTKSYVDKVKQDRGEQEANRVSSNFALMVVSDRERVDQEVTKHFPKLRHTSRRYVSGRHSESSMTEGVKQGRQININRPISSGGQYQVE